MGKDLRFRNLDGSGPNPFSDVLRWGILDKLAGRRRKSPAKADVPWQRCDPKTLATLTSFAVVRRANEAIVVPSGKAEFRYQEVVCAPSLVSSTDIRKRCLRGESIRGLVPDAVCDYIQQYHLYHFP